MLVHVLCVCITTVTVVRRCLLISPQSYARSVYRAFSLNLFETLVLSAVTIKRRMSVENDVWVCYPMQDRSERRGEGVSTPMHPIPRPIIVDDIFNVNVGVYIYISLNIRFRLIVV